MTKTLGYKSVRPHGTRHGMSVKAKLEHRVLYTPEAYEIEPAGGVVKLRSTHTNGPSLDAHEIQRIREAVDMEIYYIREDGIYVH